MAMSHEGLIGKMMSHKSALSFELNRVNVAQVELMLLTINIDKPVPVLKKVFFL